jgi:methanogenic corrinoid protein MtbC1
MIRWCAYCQCFMGESEPFQKYEMTHGICPKCYAAKNHLSSVDMSNLRSIARLYRTLRQHVVERNFSKLYTLINKAREDFKLAPVDVFMGLIQPLLYEIGEMWNQGIIDVAGEHEFTRIAEDFLMRLSFEKKTLPISDGSSGTPSVDALLTCANGNYHTLGVRALDLALREYGLKTLTLFPGLPHIEIFNYVQRLKPSILCISVSLSEQADEVKSLMQRLISGENADARPVVFLGGSDVRLNPDNWTSLSQFGVKVISDLKIFEENLAEIVAFKAA